MDYEALLGLDDLKSLFATERGSTYGLHSDGSTTGYREPSNRPDTGREMQPRSAKTFFMDAKPAAALQSWIADEYLGTKLVPSLDENKKLKAVEVHAAEDNPRRNIKAGQILSRLPATMSPAEGLHPVEVSHTGFSSPVGSKGKDVHFGSKITEIHHKPQGGGGGGGSMNLGGAGGISAGKDALKEGLNPFAINRLYAAGGNVDKPLEGNWKYI